MDADTVSVFVPSALWAIVTVLENRYIPDDVILSELSTDAVYLRL